jgi:hypothetical protein
MGNPFEEESSELYALDAKDFVDTQVAENMARLPDTGKKQYSTFLAHCLAYLYHSPKYFAATI